MSPRFNVFLLQNGSAGRCEPPFFYREASHKKGSRIVVLVSEAPFRQDATCFFYNLVRFYGLRPRGKKIETSNFFIDWYILFPVF